MIKMSMKKIDMVRRILEICEDGSIRHMELKELKTRCKQELIEGSSLRSQASFLCQNAKHTYFCWCESYLMKNKTKKELIEIFNKLIKDVQYLIDLSRSIIYILNENTKELRKNLQTLINDNNGLEYNDCKIKDGNLYMKKTKIDLNLWGADQLHKEIFQLEINVDHEVNRVIEVLKADGQINFSKIGNISDTIKELDKRGIETTTIPEQDYLILIGIKSQEKTIGDEKREIKNALIGIIETVIDCIIKTLLKERKLEIPEMANIGSIQEELENRHIQTRVEKENEKTFLILVDND